MGRRGFSLIELLIVATIILIIAAIAIPNLLRSKMAANEASCVGTLRVLNNSEVTYNMTYNSGFTGGLNVLGPPPSGQQPTYLNADLVDRNLAGLEVLGSDTGFVKSGYIFTYNATGTFPLISYYSINADPQVRGSSGQRSFFTDDPMVVRANGTAQATVTDLPI
jgi:prepilin-type N-terminal cleavage/methylation domain-containing protein